jgi:hypothetical protein
MVRPVDLKALQPS